MTKVTYSGIGLALSGVAVFLIPHETPWALIPFSAIYAAVLALVWRKPLVAWELATLAFLWLAFVGLLGLNDSADPRVVAANVLGYFGLALIAGGKRARARDGNDNV